MKKFLSIALSACLVMGALAGCGSSSSSSTSSGNDASASGDNVIKIGVFEPQTGENGGGGLQEVYGIRYANQVYPTVEVGGTEYTIQLVEVDNKSDKTEAVTAAQKLVSYTRVAHLRNRRPWGNPTGGLALQAAPKEQCGEGVARRMRRRLRRRSRSR